MMQIEAALLLPFTIANVLANSNPHTFRFLLMVASGSSPDSSALVLVANQTLKEINLNLFQLKYNTNDTHVSN